VRYALIQRRTAPAHAGALEQVYGAELRKKPENSAPLPPLDELHYEYRKRSRRRKR
jgi:hypothetical protein